MARGPRSAGRDGARRRASSPAEGAGRAVAWAVIGLGTVAVVAGFGGRKGALAFAATALAGAAALERRRVKPRRGGSDAGERDAAPVSV